MDVVSRSNRLAFVRQQLSMYAGTKQETPGATFILCPFHAERTPSGRILHGESTNSPGYFRCFGCGMRAKWDDLAPKLGLQPFKAGPPKEEHTLPLRLKHHEDLEEQGFVKERQRRKKAIPRNKRWRSIPTNLLREIGAYTAEFYANPNDNHDGYWTSRRLYLPVLIRGELRGYIKARLRKHSDYASYINASGPWSRTHGLFPYDYSVALANKIARKTGHPVTVVLVEGQRDALRLIAMGIPALCILGTQSWSDTKCKLLELGGIERVILMMDGDCAGIEATKKIRPTLDQMFEVRVVKLWKIRGSPWLKFENEEEPSKAAKAAGVDLWDPGNMPQRLLLKLKQKFFSKTE